MSSPAPAETSPDAPPLTFRGTTYDAAVGAAEAVLGARPRVLSANRIRRGGIGGFFATDLGVEIEVVVAGETIDETLERLVDTGDSTDRELWVRELASAAALPPIPAVPAEEPEPDQPAALPEDVAPRAVQRDRPPSRTAPSRRHVDLAVDAASELVRLTTALADVSVSLRVTVTGSDGRSVAIDAHIEPPVLVAS